MKKMQLAKQQAQTDGPSAASPAANNDNEGLTGTSAAMTEEEIKKSNDMKRFEDLLNREGATTRMSDDSYRTEEEELIEATASWKGKGGDRIFEGDPAPAEPFEELVSIGSENALGKAGAERLVPWLHKNVNRQNDYLVIVTDPRSKSTDLRQAMKYLKGQLTPNILARLIVVNADTPPENKRWAKKNGAEGINIFSDEKREFMRQYTALGKDRWTMSMFIVQSGRVERLVRDLDMDLAAQTVTKAVTSLSSR